MAGPTDGLSEAITNLADLLLSEDSMREVLSDLAASSTQRVTGCNHASITVLWNNRYQTMATTDGVGLELDAAQYEADEGPCVQAVRSNEVIAIEDTGTEQRFGGFINTARAVGIGSTLSFPIAASDRVFGSLNMYADKPEAYSISDYPMVSSIARLAAVSVSNASAREQCTEVAEQVTAALATRGVIEQAKGIIMARQRIDADTAFNVLRTTSQQQNRKLHDVAAAIVTEVHASRFN